MIKRHQRGLSFVLSFPLFLTAFTGFSVQTAQASPQPASERSAPPSEEELGLEDPIDETGLLEISSLRSRDSKTFRNKDGLNFVALYEDAVHYRDGEQWKNIDNTLSDMIFMLIPGIGAAFAPIKALARTYGRTALKSKLRTPLISFIKFVSNHAASILSVFKTGISKIPIIGKNLAGKIPIAKLTSAIAGMTSTIIINSIINGLLTNVDIITSIGGAISGILDILFDKKLNNSILVL